MSNYKDKKWRIVKVNANIPGAMFYTIQFEDLHVVPMPKHLQGLLGRMFATEKEVIKGGIGDEYGQWRETPLDYTPPVKAESTNIGENYCPVCKKLLDRATDAHSNRVPGPGDVVLCFYCGSINRFADDMEIYQMQPPEIMKLPPPMLIQISQVQQLILKRKVEMN